MPPSQAGVGFGSGVGGRKPRFVLSHADPTRNKVTAKERTDVLGCRKPAHTVAELASTRQHQGKLADHHGARGGGYRNFTDAPPAKLNKAGQVVQWLTPPRAFFLVVTIGPIPNWVQHTTMKFALCVAVWLFFPLRPVDLKQRSVSCDNTLGRRSFLSPYFFSRDIEIQ